MAEAIVARIGDRVQCDVRHPTPRTITMVLQTPEAIANANWLLADKSSGWRLLPSPTAHLSAYGGGNVEWWQDYIRSQLERAHEFYQSQADGVDASDSEVTRTSPDGTRRVKDE